MILLFFGFFLTIQTDPFLPVKILPFWISYSSSRLTEDSSPNVSSWEPPWRTTLLALQKFRGYHSVMWNTGEKKILLFTFYIEISYKTSLIQFFCIFHFFSYLHLFYIMTFICPFFKIYFNLSWSYFYLPTSTFSK